MSVTGQLRSAAHLAPHIKAAAWAASPHQDDRRHVASVLRFVPPRLHAAVVDAWAKRLGPHSSREANLDLCDVRDAFGSGGLDLAASDAEIQLAAERYAREVRCYLAELTASDADHVRIRLAKYASAARVQLPQVDELRGIIARLTDARWWRRALRRACVREVERQCIRLGFVHRRASVYASSEAVARRSEQKRRNARALTARVAVNDSGQEFTLAELAEKSISNPAVRRAELMTRIGGFERFAAKRGDAAMFYTVTCPSRMHARLALSGDENPKFDGTAPRDAQGYLARTWARARAALQRRGVWVYGFRIAEPHHDGTPHWHLLLFMRPDSAAGATEVLRDYFGREDAAELSNTAAREARFLAKEIDPEQGSAAGYVAKYVAKNVDGFKVEGDDEAGGAAVPETVAHVDAWASTWGIRQFQQIGGPGVTIWRELRRLREPQQLPLFDPIIETADAGRWPEYVEKMGGIEIRRRDRMLNIWRVDYERETCYGERAPAAIEGVSRFWGFEFCRTRLREWSIERARVDGVSQVKRAWGSAAIADTAGAGAGAREPEIFSGLGVPWTRVNNCTQDEESGGCDAWRADYERAESLEADRGLHGRRDARS